MVYSIMLSDTRKVSEFVAAANKFTCPVIILSEHHRINAKSIMGMMTLDLSKKLTVEIDDAQAESFETEITRFIVK